MNLKYKRPISYLLALLLLLSLLTVTACKPEKEDEKDDTPEETALTDDSDEFDRISNDLFVYYVSGDTLTLNYMVASPEAFDIEVGTPTLGDYTVESMEKAYKFEQKQLKLLKTLNTESFNDERLFTYKVLLQTLEQYEKDDDYFYYNEPITPTIGMQAELPILFVEYHIYAKEDFDTYIALLEDVPRYFDQILAFEQEKKDRDLFMASSAAIASVAQMREFTADPETNLLLHTFDARVDAFEGLTDEERADLKERNRKAVLESVVPAYNALADGIEKLNEDNTRDGGLTDLENGTDYFEYYIEQAVGTQRSVEEIETLIDDIMTEDLQVMLRYMITDESLLDQMMDPVYPETSPEAILDYLMEAIEEDYPPREDQGYTLKTVDPSMEEHLSPAFYLIPPIDQYTSNVVYLNNGKMAESTALFSVLAHEAYPGHLYQTVYYKSQDKDPILQVLSTGGYVEGWATYVEHRSYELAEMDETLADALRLNDEYTLGIYGKADIGVNYHGWDRAALGDYLAEQGVTDTAVVNEMYDALIAEPGNYLKYCLGGLEFSNLRQIAEDELGKDFDVLEYHTFILETGPAPFNIIEDAMYEWMGVEEKTTTSGSAAKKAA